MNERTNDIFEEKIAALEKSVSAMQELLALVLDAVGEPVTVSHERIADTKKNGWGIQAIQIDGDPARGDDLVLYMTEVPTL